MDERELMLRGLQLIAADHLEALRKIEAKAQEITGEESDCGYTSDYINGNGCYANDPKGLLARFTEPENTSQNAQNVQ